MRFKSHVFVCLNEKHCGKLNSENVQIYLKQRLKELNLTTQIRANKSGCLNACDYAPACVTYPSGQWLQLKDEIDAEQYLQYIIGNLDSIEHLLIKFHN